VDAFSVLGELGPAALAVFVLQALRRGGLPKKFSPLAALPIGAMMAWLFLAQEQTEAREILRQGVLIAFAAVGIHSSTKNTVEAFKSKEQEHV
jgi:hypothetical protein